MNKKKITATDKFGNIVPDADTIKVYSCKCKKALYVEYLKGKKVICHVGKAYVNLLVERFGTCNICKDKLSIIKTIKNEIKWR